MISNPTQRLLGETFRNTILAWSRSGELRPVIADPLWPTGDGVQVSLLKNTASPQSKTRFSLGDTKWPELGLHAYPYPCLLCVFEGAADIRIGTVAETTGKSDARRQGVCVFSLPVRSCLLVPSGVPYTDGKTPHWERPHPENAHSQILWLRVLPTGAIIHICRTVGSSHTHTSGFFIKDAQLSVLTQLMMETIDSKSKVDDLFLSYLATLLLCVDRNWSSGKVIQGQEMANSPVAFEPRDHAGITSKDSQDAVLERACRYIHSHITDAISPDQIARQSYVSVPQLKRIFRARLDTSIMKYVTHQRIEEAKNLLQVTGLAVEEIGEICGYPHRTHFSRVFKTHVGLSPQAFRSRIKSENHDEQLR